MRRILAQRDTKLDNAVNSFLPNPALLQKKLEMTGKNWSVGKYALISGGIAGENEGMDTPQLAPDELRAVTEIAHAWGRKVTAHAGPAGAIREAIE